MTSAAPATIDRDTSRPRHYQDARFYQIGSHPAITEATGPFPSYSTVAGLYTNAGALMAWAVKINSQEYSRQFLSNGSFITAEHAAEIVSDTGHYRRQRDAAAQSGTDLHDIFQQLVTHEHAAAPPTLTEGEAAVVLAMQRWIAQRKYEQMRGEEIIADPRHRTAGRFDSLGRITLKRTPAHYLVDLKTGKSVKPSSFLQVAGYWAALEHDGANIDAALILHAPLGCTEVTEHIITRKELREHYKAFLAVRALWDWHVKHGGLR